ncbi:hypothetical protein NQ317_001117 [Molorchus minor]|uniref:RNA-directed DNA polymerase from transposon BS n=1 Tax=Molorchus minor TaxID=1323400 RepID=A0ABQ9JJG3_9CUCU|nr:hypothetical protein NQ317_001117 [Molorchus minor]
MFGVAEHESDSFLRADKFISKSDPVKLLGVTLDTRLNWGSHIDCLCSKVSSQIFVMRQLRIATSDNVMKIIYFVIVHSHLTYGTAFWGNASNANKVFRLQKAAVRIIDGAQSRAHCQELFKKYKILPLPCIYILQVLLEIHSKIDTVTKHNDMHKYDTRGAENLVTKFSRICMTKNNKVDISLYNKLENVFKNTNIKKIRYKEFNKFAKDFLMEHCFYSVREYLGYV